MLFLESFGITPDIVASYDPISFLNMFHCKNLVMLVAHVTNPEVDGRTVSRGGLHHLGHHPGYVDPWFIDLLLYFPMNGRASFALGC